MDALLARLVRVQRRPGIALAIGAGALAGAAALVFALRGGDAPVARCDPPARDVAAVWSPAIRAELAAATSDAHVAVFDTAYWGWRAARGAACGAPLQVRPAQLTCLDGVLARIDALRQAAARPPAGPAEAFQAELVDPAVCAKPAAADIPRLTLAPTPRVIEALALLGRSEAEHKPGDAEIAALAAAAPPDACARGIAALAFEAASHDVPRIRSLLADAVGVADQCGDERLRAELMIDDAPFHWELPMIGPRGDAAMRQAQIAAARVMQPDVAARLAARSVYVARQRGRWQEAFRLAEAELAGYRARGLPRRQLQAVISRNFLRISRCEPGDLQSLAADVRTWRPLAIAMRETEPARQLDVLDALARFQQGDVAAAHADLLQLWRTQPPLGSPGGTVRITGEVVDRRGRPVAGASVAAAGLLIADSVGVGLPTFSSYDGFQDDLKIATTDAAGRFAIEGASPSGAIAAQLGDQRSAPVSIADRVKLVLQPTRRISGTVDFGALAHTQILVHGGPADNPTGRFRMIAPVAADGSFAFDGATVDALWLGAGTAGGEFSQHVQSQGLPASPAPVSGVALRFTQSSRTLDAIVRSAVAAPLEGAQVIVVPGKRSIGTAADLIRVHAPDMQWSFAKPVVGEDVPRAVIGKIRHDDLVAHIEHATPGDVTACAIGISGDLLDPQVRRRFLAHLPQFTLKCEHVGPSADVVLLVTPPQQRFDE